MVDLGRGNVVLDMHEYMTIRQYSRYHMAADSLFSPAKNLNIHPTIRKLAENLLAANIADSLS